MALNPNDVLYFVITDRFYGKENSFNEGVNKDNPFYFHGGNFDGLIEKIPYLKKLGVTALWITPVYLQIPLVDKQTGNVYHGYHGYWALDFNSVDPHLYIRKSDLPDGSKLYLKELVDRMHENGIKVVLDMVVNHTGYNHPALTDAADNPTPIKSNWFNRPGLDCSQDVVEGSLAGLPDLDLDNIDVIQYHIDTILSWIEETGIDAIRMDTVRHVEKRFWYVYKNQVKGKYPNVSLLGEVLEFDFNSVSNYQKLLDFDSVFDFPLQQCIKDVFIYGAPMTRIVSPFNTGEGILEKDFYYTNPNMLTTLLDNHDLSARFMTWAIDYVGGKDKKQFAVWIHKLALTFLFTIRGIPQIYYGTEIGMEGGSDPDNRRDFNWSCFDDDYEVKIRYPYEKEIYDHCRNLIRIRKEHEALSIGNWVTLYVDDFILVYLKYFRDDAAIVVLHNGWHPMQDYLKISLSNYNNIPSDIRERLTNCELNCLITQNKIRIVNGEFWIKMFPKSSMILV